jgi:AcrR family transcriptional regulator
MPTELRRQKDAERKERTRTRLLDAAASVFASRGFHSTLVSDIVAEAGTGQGTFYRHFSNKREIFEALFDRLFAGVLAEFTPMSTSMPSCLTEYRDASVALLRRLAGIVERNRDLVLLFLRQASAVDRDFEMKVSDHYDRLGELARFYLDHAVKQGFARQCRSDLVAQSLLGMGLRMLALWLDERIQVESVDVLIEELVDFAFLGFGSNKEARDG